MGDETTTLSRRRLLGAGLGLAASAIGARAAIGATSASAVADPYAGSALLPPSRIGIQLYSVRDAVSSLGFATVLQQLAEMGYKQVEFAGYTQGTGPITVKEIRKLLDANGLKGIGSHLSLAPTDDASFQQALDDAQTLGLPQIGVSFVVAEPPTVAGWTALAKQFNHYGALAAKRGLKFYLHNHFQEWLPTLDNPARRGEDILLAETDPKLVYFEMDIYWAYVGAFQSTALPFDPLRDYAVPFRSRYLLFHVKDGKHDQSGGYADSFDDITDAGQGNIDFAGFFSTLFAQSKNEKNSHWYIQERDNASSHPRGPLAASQCSYVYMRYGIVGGR